MFNILKAMNKACPIKCFCSIQDTDNPGELLLVWQFKLNNEQCQLSHLILELDYVRSNLSITDKIDRLSKSYIKPYLTANTKRKEQESHD